MDIVPRQVDMTQLVFPEKLKRRVFDMDIAYLDVGNGPVIFCLPPWPDGSTALVPFITAFSNNFRVIALDLPGWSGYSTRMELIPSIQNYTKIIEEFILSFNFNNYSILGYSFGGVFAQFLVENNRINPDKIVMVSTLHSGKYIPEDIKIKLGLYKMFRHLIPAFVVRKIAKGSILSTKKNSLYKLGVFDTAYTHKIISESEKASIYCVFNVLFSLFETEYNYPTKIKKEKYLVIYAEKDHEFIQKETKEMADYLGLTAIEIKGADHDHFAYEVNKTSDIILNFLNS